MRMAAGLDRDVHASLLAMTKKTTIPAF